MSNDSSSAADRGSELSAGLGVSVGGTVWVFDLNRRVYRERKPGELYASGGPIWREHWRPRKVIGETARSWVLEWGAKVPKKGADPAYFVFSEADIDRRSWVHENQHKISRMVESCNDYETLLKVAAALGFETPNAELTGA